MGKIGLNTFLKEVEKKLNNLSLKEIKDIVLSEAVNVESDKRESFIQKFLPKKANLNSEVDDSLYSDIEGFMDKVEGEEYSEGWGWDDEIYDEREYGDESWVGEIEDLFERIDKIFLAGEMKLAFESYNRLFDVFIEEYSLPGQDSPEDMMTTDLNEEKARCLRALYEIAPEKDKGDTIYGHLRKYYYIGEQNFDISSIKEAYPKEISGWKEFLKDMKGIMINEKINSKSKKDNWINPYPIETFWTIVDELEGLDGFKKIAEEYGSKIEEVFNAWFERLSNKNKHSDVLEFYKKYSKNIKDKELKAKISDIVLNSALKMKNKDFVLKASKEAFISEPTLERLISCWKYEDDKKKAIEEIIAFLENQKNKEIYYLLARAYILNDEHKKLWDLIKDNEPLGWSSSFQDNPSAIAVPFFLISCVRNKKIERKSALESIWNTPNIIERLDKEFKDIVNNEILKKELTEKRRMEQLSWAKIKVKERVNAIVSGKHRKSYNKAALLLIACYEAIKILNNEKEAKDLIEEFLLKYNHYPAFKQEMKALIDKEQLKICYQYRTYFGIKQN